MLQNFTQVNNFPPQVNSCNYAVGEHVSDFGASSNQWIKATVLQVNADGTYNLDCKKKVKPERLRRPKRKRVPAENIEGEGSKAEEAEEAEKNQWKQRAEGSRKAEGSKAETAALLQEDVEAEEVRPKEQEDVEFEEVLPKEQQDVESEEDLDEWVKDWYKEAKRKAIYPKVVKDKETMGSSRRWNGRKRNKGKHSRKL